MTVPFRPTVPVQPERDFLDTVTRAFSQGRAFIERERESRRRAEEFETQQQNAALAQQSLESELEAREFARRREAFADPSLVTTPTPPLGGRAGGPEGGGAEPGAEGLFETALQPPQGQFDQPIGGDVALPEAPTEPVFEPPAFEPEPVDRPELGGEVFGEAGGEAVEIPRFDVTAEAPERPGVPPPAPPTVDQALATELGGQGGQGLRQEPPRTPAPAPQLDRVGNIGGQQFFFDPEGESRAEQRQLTQSGQQVQQVLNGLAAREDAAGRTAEGDFIRGQMNEIIAQVEAGVGDPSQVITSIIARARQNAQLQQFRDFLTNEIGEENVPDGLNELPLEVQVQELQAVRQRLNRPPRQGQQDRGALSEASIAGGVRQLLEQQGLDPNTASTQQINEARTQFIRFARGGDPGQPDPSAGRRRDEANRPRLARMITRLLGDLERLEEDEDTIELRQSLEQVQSQASNLSGDDLIQAIRNVNEQQRAVDRIVAPPPGG